MHTWVYVASDKGQQLLHLRHGDQHVESPRLCLV